MVKKHPSAPHAVRQATPPFETELRRDRVGGEWYDTDALFGPSVLPLYPDLVPFPGAVSYGVGYGELVACDGTGRQVAVWYGDHWKRTRV